MEISVVAGFLAPAVSAHPNPGGLPGSNVLQQLVNGAEAWALAVALLGALVGAALWALASPGHNPRYAGRGGMAAALSAAAAPVIGSGAAPANISAPPGPSAKAPVPGSR